MSLFSPARGCNNEGSGIAAPERNEEASWAEVGSKVEAGGLGGLEGVEVLRPERVSQIDMTKNYDYIAPKPVRRCGEWKGGGFLAPTALLAMPSFSAKVVFTQGDIVAKKKMESKIRS